MDSQVNISKIHNAHIEKFMEARDSIKKGSSSIYLYGSQSLRNRFNTFVKSVTPFSEEYKPNPFVYQHDLELFIFLNYDELKDEEIEYGKDKALAREFGPTSFPRYQHLLNAFSIRWPTRKLPSGEKFGDLIITPWLEDFVKAISEYQDTVVWGGAGQGKTYGYLALMCEVFDFFIYTKGGAQCSYSTTSEFKLKGSTWGYVNKLYSVPQERIPFSLYAGKGRKGADYTFQRIGLNGKPKEQGGKFQGVLLQKGLKDSRVVDKLTGSHDCIARIYLLDEAQTTDSAPVDAYTNMFLHPKYKWFGMSGNYDLSNDLLGINVEPNLGWRAVNENTHMYEGTLKSLSSNLDRKTLIIHYNNELSPCVIDPSLAKAYPHMPNRAKRDELYPTEDSKNTIAYKRFWIGWKYDKRKKHEAVLWDSNFIECYSAHKPAEFIRDTVITVGSFDSAPASVDRNCFSSIEVGIDSKDGYPIVELKSPICFQKPTSDMLYHKETTNNLINTTSKLGIRSGHFIMDWTNRTALIELCGQRGLICHHLIYNNAIPKKRQVNPQNKSVEDVIELETCKTFAGSFEKNVTSFAHEKVKNRITLGAYIMRLFIEKGRVRGFNANLLNTVSNHNGFEKEFLNRKFIQDKNGIISLDSKEEFNNTYGFSPDICDTYFQAFYLIYVVYGIRPTVKSMRLLKKEKPESSMNRINKLWTAFSDF